MFSSTEIRRRGLTDFLTSYEQCCVLHNSIPLKIVTSSFCNNCLSIDASKVKNNTKCYLEICKKNFNNQGSSLRLDTIFACCFKREKIAKIAHYFNMALLATHADNSPR